MADELTDEASWIDLGAVDELKRRPLQQVLAGRIKLALSFVDGAFAAISGVCNHVGGPLGEGRLDGAYVVCPWHNWKFHHATGEGEPGFEQDRVPRYALREAAGRLLVDVASATPRRKSKHAPHPLARALGRRRAAGGRHLDDEHGRRQPALLDVGRAARHRPRARRDRRLRDAAPPAA